MSKPTPLQATLVMYCGQILYDFHMVEHPPKILQKKLWLYRLLWRFRKLILPKENIEPILRRMFEDMGVSILYIHQLVSLYGDLYDGKIPRIISVDPH